MNWFVYSCTVNWFMELECIGDRQEYHTDGTLHILRINVQGTDITSIFVQWLLSVSVSSPEESDTE